MKKNIVLISLVAIAAVSACSKIELPDATKSNSIKSFSMSMPEMNSGTATKTGMVYDGGIYKLVWKENDVLAVTTPAEVSAKASTLSAYFTRYQTTSNNTSSATFSFLENFGGEYTADENYYVFYTSGNSPRNGGSAGHFGVIVPDNQTYEENGIASYTMPMFGYGNDLNSLSMKCLANVLRLKFYSAASNVQITSITLESKYSGYKNGIAGIMALSNYLFPTYYADPAAKCSLWSIDSNVKNSIVYNCSSSDILGNTAGTATSYNIVLSRHLKAADDNYITATIAWKKDGVVQTPRVKILTSLTKELQLKMGTIFTFPAVDISNDSAGWD